MTNAKKIDKIILFIVDNNQKTRYVTAKFEGNELIISYSNFNHVAKKDIVNNIDFRYKFDCTETQKFIKLFAKDKYDFLYKLQQKFNTSSACADIIKYADENNIEYHFIPGHEGDEYYRYVFEDIYLDNDLLYDKNGNIIIPSFHQHPKNGIMKLYLRNGKLYMTISYKNNKKNGFTKCYLPPKNKIFWEQNYTDGELDGIARKYYENGKLERQETFVMGVKEGIEKYYSKKGYLKQEEMWAKNTKNGFSREYYADGRIKCELFYKNGKILVLNDNIGIDENINTEPKLLKKSNDYSNFNLDFINCTRDIKFLTDKIITNKNLDFSICIYGDPGTGKSAYARYLADNLGLEVITKSAADLLNQYVGEGEKNIQKAFEDAKEKKAMLIIDEVDSVLRSRGFAQRNWEVTVVNQMLTCMEDFNYPFICTTNFIDSLDQASLRRFTFKFKFGFLKQNQIETAFNYIFKTKPSEEILKMKGLTVSDFVNIKKECDILGISDIKEIAKMLDEVVSLKKSEDLSTNIGFN